MKFFFRPLSIVVLLLAFAAPSQAAELPSSLILKTNFRTWEINPKNLDLFSNYQKTDFSGLPISIDSLDSGFAVDLISNSSAEGLDMMKIRRYLETVIAPGIDREASSVTIDMTDDGKVTFEGTGFYGRKLDIERGSQMFKYALENGLKFVNLPLIKQDPEVTVKSEKLKEMGIKEFVSSGETDFSGSPGNRIHNINTGLSKFEGHIVKPGEEFVFGEVLGPVNGKTGYLPELVIKGDRLAKEDGGGLCQVSSTAYRAAMAAGFPVTDRRNHSFAVNYYSPLGLDATVYPPTVDMKFKNDTVNHLLMQSFTVGSKAYYNFYGTKTNRTVHMIGPYYSGWTAAPPTRTEFSEKLAPGEVQVLGHAVPGVTVAWFRHVRYNDEKVMSEETGEEKNKEFLENIYSKYQARPNFYMKGVEPGATPTEGVGG